MHVRLLCLSVLISFALSGCAQDSDVPTETSDTAIETASRGPTSGTTSPSPTVTRPANSIRVSITSHCGVHSVWVRDELWLANPPLGGHGPPPGWDENETAGWFVVTSAGHGEFRGEGGQKAFFRLAEPGALDPIAGCE